MDIVRGQWLYSVPPEIHGNLAPVVRRMVDDVKKHILQRIGKQSAFGIFVIDTFFEFIGARGNLERIPLVFIVDVAQRLYIVQLPNLEFRFPLANP